MSYNEVLSFQNLIQAGNECCKGSRWKHSTQAFELTMLRNTARLRKRVLEGSYRPEKTYDFILMERGKRRYIRSHKISDRQLYKSLCAHEIKPAIASRILRSNAASQVGKGTDYSIKLFRQALAKAYRKWRRDFYVITFDYHDYFASIPHDRIPDAVGLTDERSGAILKQYIGVFPGDKGIGIGGEPSQDIAVVYPSRLDRMLACDSRVLASGRYMDDGYAICHTRDEARAVLGSIRRMSERLSLILNEKRTRISCMAKDSVTWLKKRTSISPSGRIIMKLTRKNIRDEIRRIRYQRKETDAGRMPFRAVLESMVCWCSYAGKYNSHRQMLRVLDVFAQAFDLPWNFVRELFKRRHKGWLTRGSRLRTS